MFFSSSKCFGRHSHRWQCVWVCVRWFLAVFWLQHRLHIINTYSPHSPIKYTRMLITLCISQIPLILMLLWWFIWFGNLFRRVCVCVCVRVVHVRVSTCVAVFLFSQFNLCVCAFRSPKIFIITLVIAYFRNLFLPRRSSNFRKNSLLVQYVLRELRKLKKKQQQQRSFYRKIKAFWACHINTSIDSHRHTQIYKHSWPAKLSNWKAGDTSVCVRARFKYILPWVRIRVCVKSNWIAKIIKQ